MLSFGKFDFGHTMTIDSVRVSDIVRGLKLVWALNVPVCLAPLANWRQRVCTIKIRSYFIENFADTLNTVRILR